MTPRIMAAFGDIIVDPIVPVPLILFLGLALGLATIWAHRRTAENLQAVQRGTLVLLRLVALALVLAILLQPSRLESIPSEAREKVTLIAVDTSRSMRQTDADRVSRLDAARELVWSSGVSPRSAGDPPPAEIRFFHFGADAAPVTTSLADLTADDRTTRFHQSLQTILGSLGDTETAAALFLLTDGHDFELANASQTALLARSRQMPIYAVSLGGEGNVRDLSTRITTFQPFHYARQTIRLTASIRILGCPYETLQVVLLREGKKVQTRSIPVREEAQVPVQFELTEEAAGQFEYRIDVAPLPGEVDSANNQAAIYCNVIDKKIRVLVLEGEPYWDSTFLLRSLRRNDKIDVDSVVHYAKDKTSILRTAEHKEPFQVPRLAREWNTYDLVVLGKGIDPLLDSERILGLQEWVEQTGGAVIFARGEAFSGTTDSTLQPVRWGRMIPHSGPVRVNREGQGLPPMRLLASADPDSPSLPVPIGTYESSERKPLTSTLATTETGAEFPVLVHRRVGAGQVLSVGVDGLWRWAFNAQSDGRTTVYDRFWDQMVLWLMGGRDFMPATAFTFRADTGNVPLGEKIQFRIIPREPESLPSSVPIVLRREQSEVARVDAAKIPGGTRLGAEYLPEQPGRYEAIATLPDGTRPVIRFATHADDAEETEVAADPAYLRRLCEASRGRLLRPNEFATVLSTVKTAPDTRAEQTRKVSIWDSAWVFWLIAGSFGLEWFLRRRWGLC